MRVPRGIAGSCAFPLVNTMKFDIFSMAAPIVAVGLAAEVLLPYGLLWLSDEFLFDIPDWALWFAFGGPPVAGVVTFFGEVLSVREGFFLKKRSKKLLHVDPVFEATLGLNLQKFFGSFFQKRTASLL